MLTQSACGGREHGTRAPGGTEQTLADKPPVPPIEDVILLLPGGAADIWREFQEHCKTDKLPQSLALAGALVLWNTQNPLDCPGQWSGDSMTRRADALRTIGERLTRAMCGESSDPRTGQLRCPMPPAV